MDQYCLHRVLATVLTLFISIAGSSVPSAQAEEFQVIANQKRISLLTVLEKGLRDNPDQQLRYKQNYIYNIQKDSIFDTFWYPQLSLTMQTQNQRIGSLLSKDKNSTSTKVPGGYVGFEAADYTLFNWGKDYLNYQNQMITVERNLKLLSNLKRNLRLDLIHDYFYYLLLKKKEQINRDYVKNSTFIYRIGREKSELQKITLQEYYQSRSLYLDSQNEYNNARIFAFNAQKDLTYKLGDDPFTVYTPNEDLRYIPLKIELDEAIGFALKNNIPLLNAEASMKTARNSFTRANLDSLPLPQFDINLGSYLHSFSKDGTHTGHDTNIINSDGTLTPSPGGSNIELRAAINMTWTLWGGNGFFNTRLRQTAYYNKLYAENVYKNASNFANTQVRELYNQTKELQLRYQMAASYLETARKQFDQALDRFMKEKNIFLNVKDAVNNLRAAELNEVSVRFNHLESKLELAKTIGMEDFPGENFENLALQGE